MVDGEIPMGSSILLNNNYYNNSTGTPRTHTRF